MPAQLPQFILAYPLVVLLVNRDTLSLIVFWILWHAIKVVLLRVLELNPPNPPQNLPPIDPDIPEFPRKSPLIQL